MTDAPHTPKPHAPAPPAPAAAPAADPKPAAPAAPTAPASAKPAEPQLPPQPAAAGEAKRSPQGSAPPIDMSEVDALKALVGEAVTEVGRQTDKPVAVVATPRILRFARAPAR